MATTVKLLASGSTTVNYTLVAPTGTKSALVTGITFTRTVAGALNVTLLAKPTGGTAVVFLNAGTVQNIPVVTTDVLSLGTGDELQLNVSTALNVDYAVYGIERD